MTSGGWGGAPQPLPICKCSLVKELWLQLGLQQAWGNNALCSVTDTSFLTGEV